jgi:GH25 family lysozyme M1 (1,4-beta-N-acetylmuramidase)
VRVDILDISGNQPCGVCARCVSKNLKPAIDWAHLPSNIVAVVVKLTEGVGYTDPCSVAHCAAVKQSGRKLGGYHYLRIRHNQLQDARIQARQFLAQWMTRGCDFLPVVDIESAFNTHVGSGPDAGKLLPPELRATIAECQDATKQFVDEVQLSVSASPITYTSPGEWKEMGLTSLTSLGSCPLWLAEYDSHTSCPEPWLSAIAHQWSGTALVPGVSGQVDVSELQGDLGEMLMPV